MKRIAILGSTGSIGQKTLEVIKSFPSEFEVVGLSCGSNTKLLEEQIRKFSPKIVACMDETKVAELRNSISGVDVEIASGTEGLLRVATTPLATMVVVALAGSCGLIPTLGAINAGKDIALANKESLVMAGEIIVKKAREKGITILPIDSEHSAVFQCLDGRANQEVKRLILTASGGPLNHLHLEDLSSVSLAQALDHPKWKMGQKISIDSATLMNKGLEVIEARWLFDIPIEKIEVIVHPQAIIHSMVEFVDGSLLAQLGMTDMRLPIQYALTYPKRLTSHIPGIDFTQVRQLTFARPDEEKFPSLGLAYEAGRTGHTMTAVLNAANEEAVWAYLDGGIGIMDIPRVVAKVMKDHRLKYSPTLDDILAADKWARKYAKRELEVLHWLS